MTARPLPAADVSPNAPLLIRMVRYPFSVEPVEFRRVSGREERISFEAEIVRPFDAVQLMRDARREAFRGSPMRHNDRGPQPRMSPVAWRDPNE
jgi:hypothetical protein